MKNYKNMKSGGKNKTSLNEKNDYCTYDLGCSAALISSGFEIKSLDKANPKKVRFIFNYQTGIEEIVNDYFSDKLKVSARKFFDNTKMLKNRIYSA